jgi:hypothetical protein
MKKVLSALVLSTAVVATAGQAHAFGNFELTQVIYDFNKKVEIAVDLGTFDQASDFTPQSNVVLRSNLDYVALANAKGAGIGTVYNQLRTGFYIDSMINTSAPSWDIYFVTTENVAPAASVPQKYVTFNNAANSLAGYYNTADAADGTTDGVMSRAYQASGTYMSLLNPNSTPGHYAGMNSNYNEGEINITYMTEDTADLYLWHMQYDNVAKKSNFIPGATQDYTAVLTFNKTTGAVVLNAAPVPVPAAAWLLGSGVLGLIGLRRRK